MCVKEQRKVSNLPAGINKKSTPKSLRGALGKNSMNKMCGIRG